MDKEFLKKLTILYVEDDPTIREEFHGSIEKIFKRVLVANDGKEALEKFTNNKNSIDLIISDINMPNMDGIELLKEIKKTHSEIPFIFTTAYTDEKYLLEGIRNRVSDYFVKPAGLIEMIEKIEKICLKKIQEQKIKHQQNETKEYFDLLNKVAIVYIFDNDGNLIFSNDFLNELLGINDDEIYGENYTSIFHPDMSKEFLKEQWQKLQTDEIWKGKIKYITKQNTTFFANATIMPTSDDKDHNVRKFISINFLTTKEENERREFKRQLLYNIQEAKKIFHNSQEIINTLTKELEKYKGYEKKEKEFLELRSKSQKSFKELQLTEQKIKSIKNKLELLTQGINSKISKVVIAVKNMKDSNEKNSKKIYKLMDEINLREKVINQIELEIGEKKKKIQDLEDVLKFRISQQNGKD